jgi:hypothetical protein
MRTNYGRPYPIMQKRKHGPDCGELVRRQPDPVWEAWRAFGRSRPNLQKLVWLAGRAEGSDYDHCSWMLSPTAVRRDGTTAAVNDRAVDMMDNARALPTCPQL